MTPEKIGYWLGVALGVIVIGCVAAVVIAGAGALIGLML